MPKFIHALFLPLVFVAIIVPRLLVVSQSVTIDEIKWVKRAAHFSDALLEGAPKQTYQSEHPGVTTMWAGTLGRSLEEKDASKLEKLSAGRTVMVLFNGMALAVALLYAKLLLGMPTAVLAGTLIALSPFFVGHTHLMQLDGLEGSLMLLAVLAASAQTIRTRRIDLVVSGIATGLAWLTKSPALALGPVLFLVFVAEMRHQRRTGVSWKSAVRQPLVAFTQLMAVAVGTFVLLWPAMWVSPLSSVQKIIEAAIGHASGGHTAAGFFDGVVYEDGSIPLWVLHYYPTTYLWRISPPVLLGLLLVVFVLWKRVAPLDERSARKTVVTLISYAVFFMLFMNLGSTKGDRYVVPVYPALDLVAAVGWVGLAKYSIARFGLRELEAWRRHAAVWMALGLVGLFQLLAYVSVFPYPLSYYNPLLGGGKRAPAVMQIGWGEGLDEAGRYLSKKPESKKLVVASWYRSVLAYHFDGKTKLVSSTMKSTRFKKVDYLVLYVHQWQRNLPAPLLEKFARRKPEHVVEINGIEYAKIYKLRKRAKRGADGG